LARSFNTPSWLLGKIAATQSHQGTALTHIPIPTKPSFKPKVSLQIQALAYDRKLTNRRPVFAMRQTVSTLGKSWHTERVWTAVGSDIVALEQTQKHAGALHIKTELPNLNEYASAEIAVDHSASRAEVFTRLSSDRTRGQLSERKLDISYPLATLGTLPLFVAENWGRLLGGEAIAASYLVLKVQRTATMDLRWFPKHPQGAHVAATPRNWLLRAIFGSTRLYTQGNQPVFLRQEGLLDPRDLRPNGRWKEYLGTLEFETPWDLTSLCAKESGNELV
jgi:hypothetical protein